MRNRWQFGLGIAAAGALLASACSGGNGVDLADPAPSALAFRDPATSLAPVPGGTLRVALLRLGSFDPIRLNPASSASMLMSDLLFDGLTGYDTMRGGAVVGVIAREWSVSADGLTWQFEIDPAATFADGSPIEAEDVKASIERVAALGDGSLAGPELSAVVGYNEVAAGTASELSGIVASAGVVEFTLNHPYSPLPELLADPLFGIVNPADIAAGTLDTTPVGSGPFVVGSSSATTVTMNRSIGSKAKLDSVVAQVYESEDAAYAAFLRGELDYSPVPPSESASATESPLGTMQTVDRRVNLFYGMNLAAPALANQTIRQAVLRAVNVDRIHAEVFPGEVKMSGLIGPGVTGRRDNACGVRCTFDLDVAKQMVTAVYPDGNVPTLHVDFSDKGDGRESAVADLVVADLIAAGIPAEARNHDFDAYQTLLASGQAELFSYGWIGAYPSGDSYLSLFTTSGADNIFSLDDSELTAMLNDANSKLADPDRIASYLAAEDRVFELAPLLPLVQSRTYVIVAAGVEGVVVGPNGSFTATDVRMTPAGS